MLHSNVVKAGFGGTETQKPHPLLVDYVINDLKDTFYGYLLLFRENMSGW